MQVKVGLGSVVKRRGVKPMLNANVCAQNPRTLSSDHGLFGSVGVSVSGSSRCATFSQRIIGYPSLFGSIGPGFIELSRQQRDLGLLGVGGSFIGAPSSDSRPRRYAYNEERGDVDPLVEFGVRAFIGVALLGLGIWLVDYVDRTIKGDLGWRGWLLFGCGCGCGGLGFVLLLFRGRFL